MTTTTLHVQIDWPADMSESTVSKRMQAAVDNLDTDLREQGAAMDRGGWHVNPPSIHQLFDAVRSHPDFVFGTIFVKADFPHEDVPEHFYSHVPSDRLCEVGNEMIADDCGTEEEA